MVVYTDGLGTRYGIGTAAQLLRYKAEKEYFCL